MLSGEAANTNLIVFDLTRQGSIPMIYRNQGEHANHYTTNAEWLGEKSGMVVNFIAFQVDQTL